MAVLKSPASFGFSFVLGSEMGITFGYWASSYAVNSGRLLYVVYGGSFSDLSSTRRIKTTSSAKRTTSPPDAFQALFTPFSLAVEFPRAEIDKSIARSPADIVSDLQQRHASVYDSGRRRSERQIP